MASNEMASNESGKDAGAGASPPRSARDERRAAALRDNLRRRKSQARGRADAAPGESGKTEDRSSDNATLAERTKG